MKRLKNRTLTSMVASWLLLVGLILPCLLIEGGGIRLFASGAVAEESGHHGRGEASHGEDGHSQGSHHHGSGTQGYCCHDNLVYARDEAPSAGEAILFARATALPAKISPVSLSSGLSLLNAAHGSLLSFHLRKPTSPDLFLLHSIFLI